MSKIGAPGGDDHPEAAGKHLTDASSLLAAGRADGAAYLAGYVVECTLKTIAIVESGRHEAHHKLSSLSKEALKLASLPAAQTARYVTAVSSSHQIYDPYSGWNVELRYRAAGAVSMAAAAAWVGEAHRVYASTIVPMRLDGVI